ncbi:hypothetical protein Hs30E_13260 [Lactococcus hodotermopsidis]|uniref:Peptidase S1 domain-containing protein n=1 Tax=Pseudolactococcus hodotermopsidis TaxID=2709157 RepID=A0A6A0BDL9_9LACT|nr:InlB B-repeat-containing protein [Lactococcus hodotermopsidis]GFH42775.1 hypothetical protein Hs30E_13260 [Lactococcus hodotermopsidis]
MKLKHVLRYFLKGLMPKKMMVASLLALSFAGGVSYTSVFADEKPQTRAVFGEDTRQLVTDFTNQPYRATVKMVVRFPNGSRVVGTGVLVADDFVATAAHVIYDDSRGGRAVAAEVTVGSGSSQIIGVARADGEDHFFTATDYTKGSANHDLGGIKLDSSLSNAGKLEIQETISANETLRLSGYPGDKIGNPIYSGGFAGVSLYTDAGTISNLTADKVSYSMDSYKGTSGGSVVNSNNKLVAIHSGYNEVENSGARLTGTNLAQLKSWMAKEFLTVNFDLYGGEGTTPKTVKVCKGDKIKIPAEIPTRVGHKFLGWSNTPTLGYVYRYNFGEEYLVNYNTTLYAVWEREIYTLTLDLNGGVGENTIHKASYGTIITQISTYATKEGYKFIGYGLNPNSQEVLVQPTTNYCLLGDVTLYAIWQPLK